MSSDPTPLNAETMPSLMDAGVRQAIDGVMHLIGQPVAIIADALTAELATQGRILTAEFVYRLADIFAGNQGPVTLPLQRTAKAAIVAG